MYFVQRGCLVSEEDCSGAEICLKESDSDAYGKCKVSIIYTSLILESRNIRRDFINISKNTQFNRSV